MKLHYYFLTFITIFITTFSTNAQTELIQLDDRNYSYIEQTSNIKQIGNYIEINGKLTKCGIWKLYVNGKKTTTAKYLNDEIIWIKNDKGLFQRDKILILQLKNKVDKLENDIALNKKTL